MKSMMRKTTIREIRQSFGRFFAILAITALGVGLFSGLKVTKTAMIKTTQEYLDEKQLFDIRLVSKTGFSEEDIRELEERENIKTAKGAVCLDVLCENFNGNESVLKAHTLTEELNGVELVAGEMPDEADECLGDASLFSKEDIGKTIVLADSNTEQTLACFAYKEYKITGIGNASYYINFERGNTSLGNGKVSGFFYVQPEGISLPYKTEVFLKLKKDFPIYSKAYKDELEDVSEKLEDDRWYTLTRNTNIGYACFENDADIVEGIANVFPVFFFLVAALVCMTTMNRMVEEQRTMIGVLKALGYSDGRIMGKYLFYAGSAALLGGVLGFLGGSYIFPKVIWSSYGIMYDLPPIVFVFDGKLAAFSLAVSCLCSMGTTWFTCKKELFEAAASLMRPKAPKTGKRIFLERLPFIWKHLKFLYKVSIRNVVRYKKRFFMMVLGISGCTALLVTGFGIKDSIVNVAAQQFEEIQIYDMNLGLRTAATEDEAYQKEIEKWASGYTFVCEKSVDLQTEDTVKSITMVILSEEERADSFVNLHTAQNENIRYPGPGEAVISDKIAGKYGIKEGETITLSDDAMQKIKVKVTGICENFVYNYVYLHKDTYKEAEYKSVYMNIKEGKDVHEALAAMMQQPQTASGTVNEDVRERFSNMMSSLNYIVILITFCAGFLAFIVLYNLTNINITERVREIATIKVLGFYPGETAAYVFRENLVLTAIGGAVGLLLGKYLHRFVMSQIDIDMVSFDVHILPQSYLYSLLLTFLFAFIVNGFMSVKLSKIPMAESLKSIE